MKNKLDNLIVVKRSGQRVDFNEYKIVVAIKQAFDSVSSNNNEKNINIVYEEVISYIKENYFDRKTINVEDIQDIIETILKNRKYFNVYKSFSEYRQKRAASRQIFKIKQQHKFIKALEKILEDDSLKNDNDYKAVDLITKYGKTIVKEFNKSYVIDNKFLRAHDEGYIYIEDLDCFSLGIFSNTHIILNEYLKREDIDYNLSLILTNLKKEINGALSIPAVDYLFEEYFLNKYKTLFKEIVSSNLKIAGFDLYININRIEEIIDKENNVYIDINNYKKLNISSNVKNIIIKSSKEALIKTKDKTYLIIKSMLQTLSNFKDSQVSFGSNLNETGMIINEIIFDLLKDKYNINIIYKLNDQNIKYLNKVHEVLINQNNISLSFENKFNKDEYEVEYFKGGVRIFENYHTEYKSSFGRSVLSSISINLSRLAIESKDEKISLFYERLDHYLDLVKQCLLLIFESIAGKTKANYNYLFNNNIFDDEKLENNQRIRKVIKNGVLLIGITGLKEAVCVLEKDSSKQEKLLIKILKYLNKKCTLFEEETKLNFQIYEDSKIDARKHFMTLDKSVFGIIEGVTEPNLYSLVSEFNLIKKDYKLLSKIQKEFIGGMNINLNIGSNLSFKSFESKLLKIKEDDVSYININIKGS